MDPVLQAITLRDPLLADKLDALYQQQHRHSKVDELVDAIHPDACFQERFPFYVAMQSVEHRGLMDCVARAVLLEMYRIKRLRASLTQDEFRQIESALFLSLICRL